MQVVFNHMVEFELELTRNFERAFYPDKGIIRTTARSFKRDNQARMKDWFTLVTYSMSGIIYKLEEESGTSQTGLQEKQKYDAIVKKLGKFRAKIDLAYSKKRKVKIEWRNGELEQ